MIVKSPLYSSERLALFQLDVGHCLLTSAYCFMYVFVFYFVVVAWHDCAQNLEPTFVLG